MLLLQILHFPDERLRTVAVRVKEINIYIEKIIHNMLETMYEEKGIGISSTQINFYKNIMVIDISENIKESLFFINPIILEKNGETSIEESCLSIPKIRSIVTRAKNVKVHTVNILETPCELEAKDLLAICIQHEIDHLFGTLFIDFH